ncbi:MAG TPA: FemAB family XrtA/PEP-CTERM system-associated protein [Burkholderiales bacterium]|nr:FemAB family XrtA/PEP-CTERM system-associated protein [Burkholderiales bacterium]
MKHHQSEAGAALGRADPPILIRPYAPVDKLRWDDFVARCPDATFFHLSAWKELIEGVFHHRTHYYLAEREGSVVGVLPLAQVRSRIFGHSLVSLPFCVYGGCAATQPDAIAKLHARAIELADELGVDHLELRNLERREPAWARQDLYVTFRKQILPGVDANMLAIPRKQRAMVRKGIKAGLVSEVDDSVDRFFALYADNVHQHGTPPLPKHYFSELKRLFGASCEVLTVLDSSGRPVSGVLSFYFRDQVLPYYAGDILEARDLAANDFKYWELMRRACERGCRVFDYGRSKRGTGSFDFKKNWGFEATPLRYEYKLVRGTHVPENNPLNPKYRLFIQAWRKLPRFVVNSLGPYIVRNLG